MENPLKIRVILLDMDGVLWRGLKPVLDIQALFSSIQKLGCKVYCVTNNSTKSVNKYQELLAGFGVNLAPHQFITSAEASAAYLVEHFPEGSKIYVLGEEGLKQTIEEKGFQVVADGIDSPAAGVVAGLDRDLTYQKLNLAAQHIQQGAVFVGTNPDKTIPTPSGPAPGAGAIIAALESSSGVNPVMIGKPAHPLFKLALGRSGCQPGEALMIGDRLETDILGAQNLGVRTCLVLTGITTRADALNWQPSPDRICENALEMIKELQANDGKLI